MMLSLTRLSIVVACVAFQQDAGIKATEISTSLNHQNENGASINSEYAHDDRKLIETEGVVPAQTPVSNPASVFWGNFLDISGNSASDDITGRGGNDNDNDDDSSSSSSSEEEDHHTPTKSFLPPPTFHPIMHHISPQKLPPYPKKDDVYYEKPNTPYRTFL